MFYYMLDYCIIIIFLFIPITLASSSTTADRTHESYLPAPLPNLSNKNRGLSLLHSL